jgi:hypothetical protein
MRIVLLSLTSLIILLIPQIVFAGDEEGTVTPFIGTLFGRPDSDPIAVGQMQYIEVSLNNYDKDTFLQYAPIGGTVTVADPNGDEKTYGFAIDDSDVDEAVTHVGFLIGDKDDDTPGPPLGHYTFHITANDNNAEEYTDGFEVIDHY